MAVSRINALMSVEELAEIFGVSRVTIRRWRRSGKLEAVQVGRELRFRLSDVERLIGEPLRERHGEAPAHAQACPA